MARTLSVAAAVHLTHAVVQVVADDAGVDALHIKGPALDEVLRVVTHPETGSVAWSRSSTDTDVWVRPQHVERMIRALRASGWWIEYHFQDGSPFRHATTLMHDHFAPVDLHRRFPGIYADPESAFEAVWQGRKKAQIAGVDCLVPDLTAQRLILVLHAVRSRNSADIDRAYTAVDVLERAAVDELARQVKADVALAAGTDRLDDYRGRREYRLWKAIRDGESSRARMWLARVAAEPTLRDRVSTGWALVAPKTDRLQATLGRRPGTSDRLRDLARTARLAARDLRSGLMNRGSGPGR